MTAAKASRIRALRIERKQLSNIERRIVKDNLRLTKNIWTIDKLWDDFYFQKTEEGLKGIKIDSYRYYKYLSHIFGNIEPRELSISEIDNYRLRLLKKLKPASVKQVLVLLQRIINFGFNKQLIPPLNFKIQKPKFNNVKTEMLSQDQLKSLLEAINGDPDQNIANLMKLALFTGMRKSELFSLKWDDIDFENDIIYIREPKSGSEEKIPLNKIARNIIESQDRADSLYIFPGRRGGKRVDASTTLNRIKKCSGLPSDFRSLHGLRHAYASMIASSGKVDMYTLQKLLTHKSPQMTQRYAHLRDETLKKAADLAGEIIEDAGRKNDESE